MSSQLERMAEAAKPPTAEPPSSPAESVGIQSVDQNTIPSRNSRITRRRMLKWGAGTVGTLAVGGYIGVKTGVIDPEAILDVSASVGEAAGNVADQARVAAGVKTAPPVAEVRRATEVLTAVDAFSNVLLKKPDGTYDEAYAIGLLANNPVDSPGFYLENDGAENLLSFNMLHRDGAGKDHYAFTKFDQGTGKVTPLYKQSDDILAISANSIAVSGNFINVAGETTDRSGVPAALLCNTGGANFQPTTISGLSGEINDQISLKGTTKVLMNLRSTDPSSTLGILDVNTRVVTKPEGLNAINATGFIIDTSKMPQNKLTAYQAVPSGGYVQSEIDLSTNKANSVLKHPEFQSIDGFAAVKDAQGTVTKILATENGLGKLYIVDAANDSNVTQYNFKNWLDGRGITNYDPGSLSLRALQPLGDYVWARGSIQTPTGESIAVRVSFKLGTDPLTTLEYDILPVNKRTTVADQQSMKAVKLNNGMRGILTYVRYFGYELNEAGPDGAPIKNGKRLFFAPPSTAQQAPKPRVFLPINARDIRKPAA